MSAISCDVIVVGAGPAGLAVGACLCRLGLEPTLLERGSGVGWSWHGHYDRLHLHTVKDHSALPYLGFPAEVPRYPSRTEVIAYLEGYARTSGLAPRFDEDVRRIWRSEPGWNVETGLGRYMAPDVVIATGYNRTRVVPDWPGQEQFRGRVVHSAGYRSAEEFRGRRVLVVGMGNTGAEIALDLAEGGAGSTISVRGPVVVVPRDFRGRSTQVSGILMLRLHLPMPVRDWLGRAMSRRVFGDLGGLGLKPADYGPVALIERTGRLPVVDIGTIAAIRDGRITVRPGIERFLRDGVVFTDGQEGRFDDVILATGYRPGLGDFILDSGMVLDDRGYPIAATGVVPGLHFVGFAKPKAGMLREISLTAPRVAEAIAMSRRVGQS